MKKQEQEQKVFIVYYEQEGVNNPQFAMHAKDEFDALRKARKWGFALSLKLSALSVQLQPTVTEHEKKDWLHDEYVIYKSKPGNI